MESVQGGLAGCRGGLGLGRQETSLRRTSGAAQDIVTKYGNTRFFMRSTTTKCEFYDILCMVKDGQSEVQIKSHFLFPVLLRLYFGVRGGQILCLLRRY